MSPVLACVFRQTQTLDVLSLSARVLTWTLRRACLLRCDIHMMSSVFVSACFGCVLWLRALPGSALTRSVLTRDQVVVSHFMENRVPSEQVTISKFIEMVKKRKVVARAPALS